MRYSNYELSEFRGLGQINILTAISRFQVFFHVGMRDTLSDSMSSFYGLKRKFNFCFFFF